MCGARARCTPPAIEAAGERIERGRRAVAPFLLSTMLHRLTAELSVLDAEFDMPDDHPSLRVPIMRGLACRCPACGKGKLLRGFLALAPRCEVCGLDYS